MSDASTRLLLIGGGHAHVEVLRQFAVLPLSAAAPGADAVMLVSPDRYTPYSGMLPGWIAGHYRYEECHIDLTPLTARAGATFIRERVVSLNPDTRIAYLADGRTIAFEFASIDIGSMPPQLVPGAREFAWPVKPVDQLIARLETLVERVRGGAVRRIVAVGGGAAGVEVLLAIRHRLLAAAPEHALDYAVVTDTPTLLPHHNARARGHFQRIYRERGITIHAGAAVVGVTRDAVQRMGAPEVPADIVIWAVGAAAAPWIIASGLACDTRGFMIIDSTLRSPSHPHVAGAGDIATLPGPAYPKSGVYAVRQGPVLANNLRAALTGQAMAIYTPQAQSLALISTGDRYAVAARGQWALAGRWVWRWKDRIDRKFMARY